MGDAIQKTIGDAWRKPWVRRGMIAFVLCSLSSFGAYWLASAARRATAERHAAPKLILPPCPLFLGKGEPGDLLTGLVSIWNTGDAPLHIEKLEATCDCSSLSISEKVIPPGEQADLHVGARLYANKPSLNFGIRIFSDDPQSPATYEVSAEVAEVVRFEPLELNFGSVPIGKETSRELRVYRVEGKNWLPSEKLRVKSKYGKLRAELVQTEQGTEPSAARRVLVTVRPDVPSGAFLDQLVAYPSYTHRTAEVIVRGYAVPPILASPSVLYFSKGESRPEFRERRFVLKRSDGKPIGRVAKSEVPVGVSLREETPMGDKGSLPTRSFTARLARKPTDGDKKRAIILQIEGEEAPVSVRLAVVEERARQGAEAK